MRFHKYTCRIREDQGEWLRNQATWSNQRTRVSQNALIRLAIDALIKKINDLGWTKEQINDLINQRETR